MIFTARFFRLIRHFSALIFALVFTLSFSLSAATNTAPIVAKIKKIESELDVRIGVAVYDPSNQTRWDYHGEDRFPLMSTFKTLACAKLLADVEQGKSALADSVLVTAQSLLHYAPVTKDYVGKLLTVEQACAATMITSDNTAANIVLAHIGGPQAVTAFMKKLGDDITRLDRIEPALNQAKPGDLRDTTTPNAMVNSLNKILFGDILSPLSKEQLLQWMKSTKVADSLLRSVLPTGWSIADRSGAGGYGSRGITAVVWLDRDSPLLISIYLTQTTASFQQRNQAIAAIGNVIFQQYTAVVTGS